MKLTYKKAKTSELNTALDLLRKAAEFLSEKKIDQWEYWTNPPADKLKWIKEGFKNGEFYFVSNDASSLIGMYRLSKEDLMYWGKQEKKARYIHSLVVLPEFSGKNIGFKIIEKIEQEMLTDCISFLRLDCNSTNERLCKYYVDLGFEKVGQKQMPLSLNNLYEKELHYC